MGLHVASRAGELVVRHSWGHRPVSQGSCSGLGRRAWLWVAGVEGHLWRTPLEHRLSHLRVTVGVLGCSRVLGLKLRDGGFDFLLLLLLLNAHTHHNQTWVICIIMPLRP